MSSTYTQADNVVLTVENGNYRKELIEKAERMTGRFSPKKRQSG